MTVTFEGNEYQCSTTRPDIPYALYVGDTYLLLVPREVANVHPNFPTTQIPAQQFRLELSDYWTNEYKTKVNKKPMFHYKKAEFGLEDGEIIVMALLNGSTWIPQWEFCTILNGGNVGVVKDHSTDTCADARDAADSFGLMEWDLKQTAVRP
ncbi:hypothetical protein LOCC1_G008287 [Lachnellula occidentalis]|uniref:Uncharacterized protein n=1 Tax=Lachnellula occidentalis TaxID=215460 RepID=A0A8H8RQB7_9HELO|nr:hypothetical protein LOCC1_G008287 [Lachnellula occidentalis]